MNSVPAPTTITIQSGTTPVVLTFWCTDPTATTVVFYPGTMAGALHYRALLELLVAQGCNVVGLNPVSHGDSPRCKYLFTFDDIVRNGRDALTWARQHCTGPVVIAGHSQGGITALAHAVASFGTSGPSPRPNTEPSPGCFASSSTNGVHGTAPNTGPSASPDAAFLLCTILPQHPRAIELTIFAPFARWHVGLMQGIRRLAHWFPWLPIVIPMYLSLRKILHGGRDALRPHGHMRAFYPLGFIASVFSADLSGATREGEITCPLSLISSSNDALFTPDLLHCMWDAIKAPCKQRIVLTGGGHLAPFVPRYAAEIAAHMAERCRALGFPLAPDTAQHE